MFLKKNTLFCLVGATKKSMGGLVYENTMPILTILKTSTGSPGGFLLEIVGRRFLLGRW